MTTDTSPTSQPSKKETTIAIVGGGIGGILTAIGLGKQGYTVHLFEQAAKFSEIGAGIAMYVSSAQASIQKSRIEEILIVYVVRQWWELVSCASNDGSG